MEKDQTQSLREGSVKYLSHKVVLVFVSIFLISCSAKYLALPHTPDAHEQHIIDSLYEHYTKWEGVSYCYGGLSKSGVDCSGFIYLTFKELFHLILPRVTRRQRNVGDDVSINELRAGDLLFFSTGFRKRHVGIYIEAGKFMHASSSKGVMISNLSNKYWQKAFTFAKHVVELDRK